MKRFAEAEERDVALLLIEGETAYNISGASAEFCNLQLKPECAASSRLR